MISQYILQQLNELRKQHVYCDLELIASDRTIFPIHQIVYTALNKRHFNMATQNAEVGVFDIISKKRMLLSCIDASELQLLVDFMYGQSIGDKKR